MTDDDRMTAADYRRSQGLTLPADPKPREYPETELQAAIVELAGYILRDDVIMFHVPNERADKVQRMIQKRLGVVAGVADLVLCGHSIFTGDNVWKASLVPRPFFIEVKPPGRKQSAAQKEFEKRCQAIGAPYEVVESQDEFEKIVTEWGLVK
jgi:hypothetical protein